MRILPSLVLSLAASILAGCEESAPAMSDPIPMAGTAETAMAEEACRAATATTVGKPVSDVAVFDVATAEAGIGVMMTVAGADAPWSCLSDAAGNVQGVTYTGSEGAL